jgi:DeoR/GlpR family transcriptional regulator of sugar metabolism
MHDLPVQKKHAMLTVERRDLLLDRLRRDGKLIARDLARELGLSEDSVRRDLRELAAAGLCQRVYGGALPVSPALGPQDSRSGIAPDSKRRVAAAAALTRILIRRTADTYVMASIEKLGTVCTYKVAGLSELAGIITDAPNGHPAVQQLRDQGVAIIQAA